ncbi:MAG TPA: hypothetical protein VMU01_03505 [Rhizomicrobium sp.]|nr:hypothetical protein [Rhizomicrobium sp.]
MLRRQFLKTTTVAAALEACGLARPLYAAVPLIRTRWRIKTSEGFDALCFLGPLSGDPFYADYYPQEIRAFRDKLPPGIEQKTTMLFAQFRAAGALLGPGLCLLFSGGPTETIGDLIAGLDAMETVLKPPFAASAYWDEAAWSGFANSRTVLREILLGMKAAGFSQFRRDCIDAQAAKRIPELTARLAQLDTIAEQERLLGRTFADPTIEIILLYFSKPHGIRIQGQRFLTSVDYPDYIVIRNADHELMHPPFEAGSAEMKAVFTVLLRDELLTRIVRQHDPRFGYNSLEGLIDEDTVQALEQIINEKFAVADQPASRWHESDDGMHVFAAGLYGLLKADGCDRTGGNIQHWLFNAANSGLLFPASLHAAAARVLKRDVNHLWPLG